MDKNFNPPCAAGRFRHCSGSDGERKNLIMLYHFKSRGNIFWNMNQVRNGPNFKRSFNNLKRDLTSKSSVLNFSAEGFFLGITTWCQNKLQQGPNKKIEENCFRQTFHAGLPKHVV